MIKGCNILKEYIDGETKNVIINNVSIEIKEGDFLIIMGKSGSGKTTLLHSLSQILPLTSGEVHYNGVRIDKISENKLSDIKKNDFGFVFQDNNLLDFLTIKENIELPLKILKKENSLLVNKMIKDFQLEGCENKQIHKTSGGERQRASIARAMIKSPKIIFADEPTGSLDSQNEKKVMELFKKINVEDNITIVMVTHSDYCASFGNKVIVINDGNISVK